jgi:three-Cys-motif partner protein
LQEPTVGAWARHKLDFLSRYLSAYTKILSKQPWADGFVYIDAFAGPGRARVRAKPDALPGGVDLLAPVLDEDDAEYLKGSPRVALDIDPPFSHYVFIDLNSERIALLEAVAAEFGAARTVAIRQCDCNAYLLELLPRIKWDTWRGVVFLDPFGMHVPWSTIQALAETRALEVFVNFPLGMAIQRLLPRDGQLQPQRRRKLDEYFGGPEWFDVMYQERQVDLFGEEQRQKMPGEHLAKWYRDRLQAAFGYASKARLVRNSRGGHLYYLIHAGPNKTGAKIANELLSKWEGVG